MSPQIRVAISGGGVAGATMLHALSKYPHLDVHIFESAPKFREAGVAFGIARNATAALDLIDKSATQCLERAGGVPMQGVRILLAQGAGAGQLVYEADNKTQGKQTTTIVQRADLLRELLSDAPPERLHASKKLQTIDRQADGSVLLQFADESTHECDILIGADGIHSTVRKTILGKDDPAASPRNTGGWAIMTLNPFEKAQASIGNAPVDLEDAREYGWLGKGSFLMHNILSHGTLVQFSVCAQDDEAIGSNEWQKKMSRKELEDIYVGTGWPAHLEKAAVELLCDEPERGAIYLWEHPPARTYVDGPVCVMGDAAHATTPYQGSGGGMCVEDSLILSTLLGRANSPAEAAVALKVYDQVRRPRTQAIVKSSLETGRILMGLHQETGTDAEKIKPKLLPRWDFIIDFDNKLHRDEAIQIMNAELKTSA